MTNSLLKFIGDLRRLPAILRIPDLLYYRPYFSPWLGYGDFRKYLAAARPYTLLSPHRLYVIYTLASHARHMRGDWFECGVYRGGSARLLAMLLDKEADGDNTMLHLFNTFAGAPNPDRAHDIVKPGEFSDTSLAAVRQLVTEAAPHPARVSIHPGSIPDSFRDFAWPPVSLAHIDLDIYAPIRSCCDNIYPHLVPGGVMIFDDYGSPACPGARKAIDEFFRDKHEMPLALPSGQALLFKN